MQVAVLCQQMDLKVRGTGGPKEGGGPRLTLYNHLCGGAGGLPPFEY